MSAISYARLERDGRPAASFPSTAASTLAIRMTALRRLRPSLLLKWRSFLPGRTTDGNGFTCPRHCHLAVARPALSTAIENRACESRPPGPLEAWGDEERRPCAASSTIPSE